VSVCKKSTELAAQAPRCFGLSVSGPIIGMQQLTNDLSLHSSYVGGVFPALPCNEKREIKESSNLV